MKSSCSSSLTTMLTLMKSAFSGSMIISIIRYQDIYIPAKINNEQEHLFIVTELLKENLYEFSKLNREREKEPYFTIGRLQKITKQILIALDYIHGLNLIHCDLKPENILLKDYENAEVKVIDFGSSCFIHDHLSSYVQSRSYRAPEVIIVTSSIYFFLNVKGMQI